MNAKDYVKDKPEMLVDYNGFAMQLFCVGGETVELNATPIKAKTSVFRICNSTSNPATLKVNDNVMTIIGNHCHVFACMVGDLISCTTGTLELTFWRNKEGY